ncbi:hypothetical protein VOLCADRAFT_103457 [Volvox carteri f. nagariensis]|uniref:G-patch domain-containing protein n=1 Tax=Volvox carteri f. nagariensis TaxID=3068 RepID=D8TM12_VOLCA|nr:uncharacterized protein VOLCADRAFT_103457 [Volvox carteri f. nagariensis]EFJ51558.1 hypothetical protein VOLCADRAFT_103457 [Volvox carteri f. nagariensis]|eukprot:XP_002947510.1 hypothetical protein VOLCADRAFT_103457 [Volvox carteri f. nagariensis]
MALSNPASRDAVEAKARAGLAGFKSSGVHVLEPYISPSDRSTPAEVLSTRGSRSRASPGVPDAGPPPALATPQSTVWQGHIPADNVGFQLLKKSGWSVGTGLGAGEQGRRDPIEPVLPKGTRGLGFNPRAIASQNQSQHNRKRQADGDSEINAAGNGAQQAVGFRARTNDKIAALVREELATESLGDKVARHKHVMRVEREQERGRAIERYLRSAFNDPFDQLHSDNSNPLSRSHRLTESNPLLNPIGD